MIYSSYGSNNKAKGLNSGWAAFAFDAPSNISGETVTGNYGGVVAEKAKLY